MLQSFGNFLSHTGNKAIHSRDGIIHILPIWIDVLIADIQKMAERNIISKIAANTCEASLRSWQDNPAKNLPEDLTLTAINKLYLRMINFLKLNIELNPKLLSIPGGYPFQENVSGVKISVHIVEKTANQTFVYTQANTARSLIGMSDREKRAVPRDFKSRLLKMDWLKERIKDLGKEITDILPNDPHAEHIWFIQHAQNLLDYCLNDGRLKELPSLNDLLPQTQLAQDLRLEVTTSSSCCELCRFLFSALRLELQRNGINLPIILYADTAYNNTEKHTESHGSIYVIGSKGEFFDAKLQCVTPKTKQQFSLPLEKLKPQRLSPKEQKDFVCLARIGGFVILDLIRIAGEFINEDSINPFTYIAPDSIIIYIAENLTIRPTLSAKLVALADSLNTMLASIDLRILTYWRMCFNEQLHWLLIAHRDPKYYAEARKNAQATDMNFSIDLYQDNGSEHLKFYSEFSRLWRNTTDLTLVYKKMCKLFVFDEGYTWMPFGCMVGPLSLLMLQDDVYFSEKQRYYLLKMRFPEPIIREDERKDLDEATLIESNNIESSADASENPRASHLMSNIGFLPKPQENPAQSIVSPLNISKVSPRNPNTFLSSTVKKGPPIKPVKKEVRAAEDYQAKTENELSFCTGDIMLILTQPQKAPKGMILCEHKNKQGWAPSKFLVKLSVQSSQSQSCVKGFTA